MKLLNIKLINNGFAVGSDFVFPYNTVFCVLEGNISVDGASVNKEQGIAVSKNTCVELSSPSSAAVLCLAFDGTAESMEVFGADAFYIASINQLNTVISVVNGLSEWYPDSDPMACAFAEYLVSALLGAESNSPRGAQHVDMAKRYIDENYFNDIKVEQLAELLGLDRKYLRNLFIEHVGMSTKDYLMERRIERAKELLEIGDLPISSVALSVGYHDALGFSKIFKKYVGVSPSEYKENGELTETKKEDPTPAAVRSQKEDIKYFLL